jgi:hypothetical protein
MGQPSRTFIHALLNVGLGVKFFCLFPEPDSFFNFARIGLENRQRPDRIGKIKHGSISVTAIDRERFSVTGFSVCRSSLMSIYVAQMPDGVCEQERMVFSVTESDGFLVRLDSRLKVSQIALDLGDSFESLNQFAPRAFLTTAIDSLGVLTMCVSQAVFPAGGCRLFQAFANGAGHELFL